MARFEGQIAVVTGGGRGIGAACCKQLLLDSCKFVCMLDVKDDVAQATATELNKLVCRHSIEQPTTLI